MIKEYFNGLMIEPTNICNLSCPLCPIGSGRDKRPKGSMNFRQFKSFIHLTKDFLQFVWLWGIGEPFTCPDFFKIVKCLVDRYYYIGFVTIFSYPLPDILKFAKIVKERITYFNASLHLEFVDLGSFLKKAIRVNKIIGPVFAVSIVGKKEMIPEIIKIGRKFKKMA